MPQIFWRETRKDGRNPNLWKQEKDHLSQGVKRGTYLMLK
jgi:hypothetical protein